MKSLAFFSSACASFLLSFAPAKCSLTVSGMEILSRLLRIQIAVLVQAIGPTPRKQIPFLFALSRSGVPLAL